jgi:hypothetical protein
MMAPVRKVLACSALLALSISSVAAAQARPEDLQSAAAAFGEGQRAQLRGEYARAADLFELADRSAPNAAALRSAIRNHRAAGQLARAATLALVARERHTDDAETSALADEIIAEAGTALGRVRVACEPACSLALDGRALRESAAETFDAFVDPGAHRIGASWPEREHVVREIAVAAGTEQRVELVAPEPTVAVLPPASTEEEDETESAPIDDVIVQPAPPPPSSGGLSPALFATGAALTGVALGLGIGFGAHTLSQRDAYVLDPTRERYEDGIVWQGLTNGFLFGAAALGIATVVIAVFTDWDGDGAPQDERAAASVLPWGGASADGMVLGVSGAFGGGT